MPSTSPPTYRRLRRSATIALVGTSLAVGTTGFAALGAGTALAQAPRAAQSVGHAHSTSVQREGADLLRPASDAKGAAPATAAPARLDRMAPRDLRGVAGEVHPRAVRSPGPAEASSADASRAPGGTRSADR